MYLLYFLNLILENNPSVQKTMQVKSCGDYKFIEARKKEKEKAVALNFLLLSTCCSGCWAFNHNHAIFFVITY